MAKFFNNLKSNDNKRKGHFDEYREALQSLDEKTKNQLELKRTLGMCGVVVFVLALMCVLIKTGVAVDKNKSATGNVFADKETVLIECFGDSLTEGYTVDETGISSIAEVTYPEELETKLYELFDADSYQYTFNTVNVKNYGQSGSVLQDTSCSRLSGTADIVLIQYCANNFIEGAEYEGTLEANIEAIERQGSQVFILNYPIRSGSAYEDKLSQANNYIANAAQAESDLLIDINAYFTQITDYSQDELFASDGVHLTALGYELMADYIADIIHQHYVDMF